MLAKKIEQPQHINIVLSS